MYNSLERANSMSQHISNRQHPTFSVEEQEAVSFGQLSQGIKELSDDDLAYVQGGCLIEHYPTLFGIPLTFLGYSVPCGCADAAPGQLGCM